MNYKKIAVKNIEAKVEETTKDSLLDKLLALRGITKKSQIQKFLNPLDEKLISPYVFKDMVKAVERINQAIEKQEPILIWGDFDCDGVTSTTVLYKTLKKLGANVLTFIPDRLADGHGLSTKELAKFISKDKIKLVITVDCAISNIKEIGVLNSFNVDTIITDHHATDKELPKAYAIINPQLKEAIKEDVSMDDITSLTCNSGSVIAYKLAMALLEKVEDDKLKKELLVIASCGAVADVVSLTGENRAMVTRALKILNEEHLPNSIYRLLSSQNREITSTDIGFILAPRINAVGRLANAELSFEFLNTESEAKLALLIEKLDNYNKIRQSMCLDTYNSIIENIDSSEKANPAVILINKEWHVGVIGIVAAKIVEQFNKPCFLMTIDETNHARCSIRSNDLINVYDVLKNADETYKKDKKQEYEQKGIKVENEDELKLFSGFGGHKLAGGCSFDLNEVSFEKAKSYILNSIKELKTDIVEEDVLLADIELESNDLNINIIETVNKLEPYGEGNQPPIFMLKDCILKEYKTIGKDKNHLRLVFQKDDKLLNAVKWSETEVKVAPLSRCDIAFFPRLNEFNGAVELQIELIDMYSESLKKEEKAFKIFDHRQKTGILASIADYLKKDSLDIGIWVKTPKIKEALLKYETIAKNIIQEFKTHKGIMFFDYPASIETFKEILSEVKPDKIHFMNTSLDRDIENYIKQVLGMLKYCHNKLEGSIDVKKFALTLGVTESFILTTLEILESLDSITILDIDKIEYKKPFHYEDFKKSDMFEILVEEFQNILSFKENLQTCDIKDIESIVEKVV